MSSPKSASFQLKDGVGFHESENSSDFCERVPCENGPVPEDIDVLTKHGAHQPFESSGQSKATKSVLFDTRSTIHTHSKKVQSGTLCKHH